MAGASTRDLVGAHAIMEAEPMMAAEDFSYMTRKAPGGDVHARREERRRRAPASHAGL